jgi:hypothetical protein
MPMPITSYRKHSLPWFCPLSEPYSTNGLIIQHLGVSEPIIMGVPTWGSTATSHPTADPWWDRKFCRIGGERVEMTRCPNWITSGGMSGWIMNIKPWRPSSTYYFYSSHIKPNLQTNTNNRDIPSWTYLQTQNNYTHKNNQVVQRTKFTMGAVVSCVSSQHPQDLGRSS